MITCEHCGKATGEGDIGEHWICDTCKVSEPDEETESEQEQPIQH